MCSVEHIPGPPLCSKSEAFNAFHLSSNKKGEVIKRTKVSKGHNNSYSRDIKFAATLALWADWGMFSINAIFSQVQSILLNDKTHYFVKLKGICPITLKNMAILNFQIDEVCVLPKRFLSFLIGICRYLFYIIIWSSIEISTELCEIWRFQNFKWARYALYQTNSTHLLKGAVFCHSTSSCQISSKSVKNFLR